MRALAFCATLVCAVIAPATVSSRGVQGLVHTVLRRTVPDSAQLFTVSDLAAGERGVVVLDGSYPALHWFDRDLYYQGRTVLSEGQGPLEVRRPSSLAIYTSDTVTVYDSELDRLLFIPWGDAPNRDVTLQRADRRGMGRDLVILGSNAVFLVSPSVSGNVIHQYDVQGRWICSYHQVRQLALSIMLTGRLAGRADTLVYASENPFALTLYVVEDTLRRIQTFGSGEVNLARATIQPKQTGVILPAWDKCEAVLWAGRHLLLTESYLASRQAWRYDLFDVSTFRHLGSARESASRPTAFWYESYGEQLYGTLEMEDEIILLRGVVRLSRRF